MNNDKTCPAPDLENVKPWEKNLLRLITIILLIAAFYNIFFHQERLFGILILIALIVIHAPRIFTGNLICTIPTELRIFMLTVVFFELAIGDGLSAYTYVPHYDKFMHTMVSVVLGLIGMMIIYTAYAYGQLKASLKVMFLLIVFVVMGFGAVLEMTEYFYDQVLYPLIGLYLPTGLTQGTSVGGAALADTMQDLYLDTLGGIFGAIIGVWFIKRSERKGDTHLIDEIAELEGYNNQNKEKD
jgi:hypothetical protein